MAKYKFLIVLFPALFLLSSFKPDEKYVRKAMREMEKGNITSARSWYEKAIEKNPLNYRANLGMGLLLSELLGNYSGAQPYLQKAFDITERDTVPALMYALAKCYQHNGDYEKALSFFERLGNYKDAEEEIDLAMDIKRRKEDCMYGMAHKNDAFVGNINVVNAGKAINTDMPEYVPVLTPDNELIFTSRRKDSDKEQLSYLDGKYFESMYISKIGESGFSVPRRYTLPDQLVDSKFFKRHESVISMSPDGKKLFVFRDSKVYEINMDERTKTSPKKLLRTINFDYYQNHAFLTRDGTTLYFTSEAKGGRGGIDIYKSTKIKEGEWSKPENLGAPINTVLDEDAPFLSDNGKTLYFASTGHKGFGNFDIFKSELVDGKWSEPVNLGQPINSPGHDIFMVMNEGGSIGYFSSSRAGGQGDMDIYRINFLDKTPKNCPASNPPGISLVIRDEQSGDFKNTIDIVMPQNYQLYSSEWKIDDEPVSGAEKSLDHDYSKAGVYTVNAKVVAVCDTCIAPVIACINVANKFEGPLAEVVPQNTKPAENADLSKVKGQLGEEQLKEIGFNPQPVYFDFAKTNVRDDAEEILKENAEILKKYPKLKVEIAGHTDSRGPLFVNKAISAQRAASVKKYLLGQGVKASQIRSVEGKGPDDLVNDCDKGNECDEASHQLNRRVVFKVFSGK
jgi:outer membrane protein OmpA-like peptidoglycan-associated protein/tetratricopeptide (TPR) repeat protein